VSRTAPTYVRNIEKGKSQKKSWYQYIFLGFASKSLGLPQNSVEAQARGRHSFIPHLRSCSRCGSPFGQGHGVPLSSQPPMQEQPST